MMEFNEIIPYILVSMKLLLGFVSVIFLISGVDDLFIDICYIFRSCYRKIFIMSKYKPLTEEQLSKVEEQPIAVMIPAWDESAIIRVMLINTLNTLNYKNFYIFVGTYPNDQATQNEIERVRERHLTVERIVLPHDGPTNKADCLNWIYQGIKIFEKKHNMTFAIFVMQDSEDVIHPLCYKLFNYLIPRKDMVQLPVFPFPVKWNHLTAGHYIDEFAQGHYKDLVVREDLNRSLPAAGVGCAFSRHAFDIIARENDNQLFGLNSLTEDYDFGFRLKRHKLKQIFVKFPVYRGRQERSFLSRKPREVIKREYICVREYFPANFWAAVRQKARWVVGITFQGWANLGWEGDLGTKYMLFRDRKAMVTNIVIFFGYLIVLTVVLLWMTIRLNPDFYRYPPLLEAGSWLWYLILVNTGFFLWRAIQRAYCVQRLYGWPQAFISFPRMIWGNVINFLATSRAIRLYARYLLTGKLISWDKTDHQYPEEQLRSYHRKLGDLLLEHRLITVKQLEEALLRQRDDNRRLGIILQEMGVVSHMKLEEVLKSQNGSFLK